MEVVVGRKEESGGGRAIYTSREREVDEAAVGR